MRRYNIGRRQTPRGQLGQMAAVLCVALPLSLSLSLCVCTSAADERPLQQAPCLDRPPRPARLVHPARRHHPRHRRQPHPRRPGSRAAQGPAGAHLLSALQRWNGGKVADLVLNPSRSCRARASRSSRTPGTPCRARSRTTTMRGSRSTSSGRAERVRPPSPRRRRTVLEEEAHAPRLQVDEALYTPVRLQRDQAVVAVPPRHRRSPRHGVALGPTSSSEIISLLASLRRQHSPSRPSTSSSLSRTLSTRTRATDGAHPPRRAHPRDHPPLTRPSADDASQPQQLAFAVLLQLDRPSYRRRRPAHRNRALRRPAVAQGRPALVHPHEPHLPLPRPAPPLPAPRPSLARIPAHLPCRRRGPGPGRAPGRGGAQPDGWERERGARRRALRRKWVGRCSDGAM